MKRGKKEMDKTCFVIMPIGELPMYPTDHFKHVYEDLFSPAILEAGYLPKRADDVKASSLIQVNVIRDIINSPMAICDLSTRNPNVLFELGLRQAFDLPVVLVQEENTPRIFDISVINTIDYRKELIYREVLEDRLKIKQSIEATQNTQNGINSLIKLLNIEKADYKNGEIIDSDDEIKYMLRCIMKNIGNLKVNNRSFLEDSLKRECQRIMFSFSRPEKGIDEMVEICKWARERFDNFVNVNFDDLAVSIEIYDDGLRQVDLILAEIKRVLDS